VAFKKYTIGFLFLLVLHLPYSAAAANLPQPAMSELIQQSQQDAPNMNSASYEYRCKLTQEEIANFYRILFLSQGLKENSSTPGTLVFAKFPQKVVTITFSQDPDGQVHFMLTVNEFTKMQIVPTQDFKNPQTLDFMPTYTRAQQFVYNTFYYPMIGVAYLSRSDPGDVVAFYAREKSAYGWQLASSAPQQGTYDLFSWIRIVDPFTKAIPMLQATGYQELAPPLKLRGQTLTFSQQGKSCTITIYKFEDIIAKAQGTAWDASPFQQYGDTVIAIYYFSKI